jgi:hypothetical protein
LQRQRTAMRAMDDAPIVKNLEVFADGDIRGFEVT